MPVDIRGYNPFTVITFRAGGWIQAFSTASSTIVLCFFFPSPIYSVSTDFATEQSSFNCMTVWLLIDFTFRWPSNVSPIQSIVTKVLCRIGWIKTCKIERTNEHNKSTLQNPSVFYTIFLLHSGACWRRYIANSDSQFKQKDTVRLGFANAKSSVMGSVLIWWEWLISQICDWCYGGASPLLMYFPSSSWLLPSLVWL